MKTTPLYSAYKSMPGIRCTEFGGWKMPLEFGGGIRAEHLAVREKAGLFDVSHMGEIRVAGSDAFSFLDQLLPAKLEGKEPGTCVYTPMCDTDGGIIDDLLLYIQSSEEFLLVVNAGNIDTDFAWISKDNPLLKKHFRHLVIENLSDAFVQIALQGPLAMDILTTTMEQLYGNHSFDLSDLEDLPYYRFEEGTLLDAQAVISRTGYTGEDGFEIYLNTAAAPSGPVAGIQLWDLFLSQVTAAGGLACGLGARDTLRLEAALPLYGHELTPSTTPLESGLTRFVDFSKPFVGSGALLAQREQGASRVLKGIVMEEKGIPRTGYAVYKDGTLIGEITSGTASPSLKAFIGLAHLETGRARAGDTVEVDIRGTRKKGRIAPTPFYKKPVVSTTD